MNKLLQILFRKGVLILCVMCAGAYGQKQSKTYKESFNVGVDAVIDINTSYADIEFETWDKNQVVIEATIEVEGATAEEAKAYFEKDGIKILGNSKTIEISTKPEDAWFFRHGVGDINVRDFVIDVPEFPELEPLFRDMELPDISEMIDMPEMTGMIEMPPMPPMKMRNFDYAAYEKDGEKYLKKWKAEFDQNFDKDYKKRMEEWSERMKERAEEWRERREEQREAREDMMREREQLMKEREKIREEVQADRQKEMEAQKLERIKERQAMEAYRIRSRRDSLHSGPNIFFGSSDKGNKEFKIKKSIKVKMPKSAKLKMNVRHGEVKLAENTMDMNATLSYARLHAATIEGDKTNIIASYSPVTVQHWDNGRLNINFSDDVALQDVRYLDLSANSSDVTIDRLLQSALIKNNLGALHINSISKTFKDMDISMQNGELFCALPATAYTIYVNGTSSKLSSPANLVMDVTKNKNNTVHKGYNLTKNSERSIVINTQYSEVVLQ